MQANDLSCPRYELKELAARAGVTARTVHFYIQQGLLPPAGQPGPGARYSEAHLARLLLIRRLQKEHLPLAEIRQRLGALDDEAVVRLAASTSPKAERAGRDTSALDYVRGLLGQAPPPAADESVPWRVASARPRVEERHADVESAPSVSPLLAGAPRAQPPAASAPREPLLARWAAVRAPSTVPPPVRGERSQWERIALASDIELHIRRPLTRDQNKRVERLLQAARDILEGEV